MHPFLNTAIMAARKAGNVILRYVDKRHTLTIREKERFDFVSEVDQQAENEIIAILRKAYPDHGILAEESGASQLSNEFLWLVDPLDGTNNFLHGLPFFCVSIALKHRDQIQIGVVYAPLLNELFISERGHGARMNEYRIRIQNKKVLGSYVSTGFPDTPTLQSKQMQLLTALQSNVGSIRCLGSAALELAYVAANRIDAYWEFGLNPWDVAAGSLLVQEAGGFVSDFQHQQNWLETGNIIAANPKLHAELIVKFAETGF